MQVNGRLRELHTTLEAGDRLREGVLQNVANTLDAWGMQVRCELGFCVRAKEKCGDGRDGGAGRATLAGCRLAAAAARLRLPVCPPSACLPASGSFVSQHAPACLPACLLHAPQLPACLYTRPNCLPACLPGRLQVRREKAVYHTLNKLSVDVTRKVLVAEAWVPVAAKGRVQDALRAAAARAASPVGTVFQPLVTYEPPPTFFQTSKVTSAFQGIVDAYGGWVKAGRVGGRAAKWCRAG